MTSDVFHLEGKTAVVATMHGKQAVIEPVLATFGLRFLAPPVIDTDRFGTFTRDIERAGTQREALLAKARAGLEHAPDADFCVSSEGGFGPHPQVPFAVAGFEMVALLARRTGQAIIGRHLTTTTNFMQAEVRSRADVEDYAGRVSFPSHAIVVMASRDGPVIAKGITTQDELWALCEQAIGARGSAWLEADMRAHMNPTRMDAIAAAAADLARRLRALCPACAYPDWTARLREGRPCEWCETPTLDAWLEEYRCAACGHASQRIIDPDRRAEPRHCSRCNP